ncbi:MULTISPECIES: ADP-ribosylglycohydrolase family protein [unclassified Salinibacterium]|uniref:ADP-ribosylglycohydrolase family protein n=1 Tax=unclassified Salinibacterium TaxID=2632331 RepID=UPI00143D2694|nr:MULTISPECIES: ADP-ribosylglycohydrolase family protein [unclassified Salinibacterium]
MTDRFTRTHGALLGLAMGDALGLPADYHRTIRNEWVRGRLWAASADLDAQRVAKPLLPFVLDATEASVLQPTDDTELAALAARVLIEADVHDLDSLFAAWRTHTTADDVWTGVAERSAIVNAERGLVPPATGSDNPAAASDSAAMGAVAVGLLYADEPAEAEVVARRLASITHAADGVEAAAVMAVAIARLANGEPLDASLATARALAPADSWLGENLARIDAIIDPARPGMYVLPRLISQLSPRRYSAGGMAPETIPLAFAIVRQCAGDLHSAVPLALTVARQSDSLPALVGALVGAHTGAAFFGAEWAQELDTLAGLFFPSLEGVSLIELAGRILLNAPLGIED